MKTDPEKPPARTIDGKRFVWILLAISLIVVLIAIGSYRLVLHLRHLHGLPIS